MPDVPNRLTCRCCRRVREEAVHAQAVEEVFGRAIEAELEGTLNAERAAADSATGQSGFFCFSFCHILGELCRSVRAFVRSFRSFVPFVRSFVRSFVSFASFGLFGSLTNSSSNDDSCLLISTNSSGEISRRYMPKHCRPRCFRIKLSGQTWKRFAWSEGVTSFIENSKKQYKTCIILRFLLSVIDPIASAHNTYVIQPV